MRFGTRTPGQHAPYIVVANLAELDWAQFLGITHSSEFIRGIVLAEWLGDWELLVDQVRVMWDS